MASDDRGPLLYAYRPIPANPMTVAVLLLVLVVTLVIGPIAAGPGGLWPLGGLCFLPLGLVLVAIPGFDPRVPVGVTRIYRGDGGDPRSIRASRGAHGDDREALLERPGLGDAGPREGASRPDRGRLPRVLSASLDRRRDPRDPVCRGLWTHARGPDHRARAGPRPPRRLDGSHVATKRAAERDSLRAGEVPRAPPGESGDGGKSTLNKVNSSGLRASTFVGYATSSPAGSPSRSRTW